MNGIALRDIYGDIMKISCTDKLLTGVNTPETDTLLKLHNLNPKEYLLVTKETIEELESSIWISPKNYIVKINYTQEAPLIMVDGLNRECAVEIPLEKENKIKFNRKWKNKIFYCTCSIKYTEKWQTLSLHNMKPLEIKDAVKMWKDYLFKFQTLEQRINKLIETKGLNPSTLLLREKIVLIARDIPIAEEKYILMDFGPMKRGKTTSYKKFDIYGKSFANTRASTIINFSNGEFGDFFNTISDVFLAEEVQNLNNPEVWTFLQTYSDGNKGEVVLSPTNIIRATTSCCLLGNPNKSLDFIKIFADKVNIFENTSIPIKKGESSGAKLSRMDAMLYSGGCRNISPNMHLSSGTKVFPIYILKQAFFELRKKHIDTKDLVSKLNLPRLKDDRTEISVHKTLEGFLKILVPELFLEENPVDIFNHFYTDSIKILYYLAIELKKVVESTINILTDKETPSIFPLHSERLASFGLFYNYGDYIYTPHRIIFKEKNSNTTIKIPLDIVGIKQNEDEFHILNLLQKKGANYFPNFNGTKLQHSSNATFNNIIEIITKSQYKPLPNSLNNNLITLTLDGKNPALFDYNGNVVGIDQFLRPLLPNQYGQFLSFEQYRDFNSIYSNGISRLRDSFGNQVTLTSEGKVIMPLLFKKNPYWNKGIFYNYLIGEDETQSAQPLIRELSFYDVSIN